jgi:forkhead box protein J2/3
VPRPLTDRGKGAYWTINDAVDPRQGVQRVRKKKPRGPTVKRSQDDAQLQAVMASAQMMGAPMIGENGEAMHGRLMYPAFP